MARPWTTHDIPDLSGRVALVTGGNAGLGLATVGELARHGAHVILTSRSAERGAQAIAALGDAAERVDVLSLDLADLASIADAAEQVRQRHERLDLLVNNAGIMAVPAGVTTDGFERQMGTNHLGHFALTGRLLDLLVGTQGARVVNVSSIAHRMGEYRPGLADAPGADYKPWRAYGASKLSNLLFTYELQRRLTSHRSAAIALAAHPGTAGTGLGDHLFANRAGRVLQPVFRRMTQSPEAGAWPTLRAATDPAALGGQYYGPRGLREQRGAPVVVTSIPASYDVASAQALWQESEELTGVSFPV